MISRTFADLSMISTAGSCAAPRSRARVRALCRIASPGAGAPATPSMRSALLDVKASIRLTGAGELFAALRRSLTIFCAKEASGSIMARIVADANGSPVRREYLSPVGVGIEKPGNGWFFRFSSAKLLRRMRVKGSGYRDMRVCSSICFRAGALLGSPNSTSTVCSLIAPGLFSKCIFLGKNVCGSRIYSLSEAIIPFTVDTVFIAETWIPPTIVSGRNSMRQVESASILLRLSAIETGSRFANCADCCTPIEFVAPKRAGINGIESAEA